MYSCRSRGSFLAASRRCPRNWAPPQANNTTEIRKSETAVLVTVGPLRSRRSQMDSPSLVGAPQTHRDASDDYCLLDEPVEEPNSCDRGTDTVGMLAGRLFGCRVDD